MVKIEEKPSDHARSSSTTTYSSTPPREQQSPGQQQQQRRQQQSAVLAQCLKLLKGDSDEHKFAGLVMVTKHIPAITATSAADSDALKGKGDRNSGADQLRQICGAVGPNFVHRLLRTTEDRGGHHSKVEGGARGLSVYQKIALGVLAAFLRDESLMECFIPIAPALVRTIRAADAVNQTQALTDALECAQALARSAVGMERLLRAGAAAAVVGRLVAASAERTHRRQKGADSYVGGVEENKGMAGDARSGEFFFTPAGLGSDASSEKGSAREDSGTTTHAEAVAFAFVGRALEASSGNCLGVRELTTVAEAFRDDPTSAKFGFMDLLLRWAVLQESEGDTFAPRDEAAAKGVASDGNRADSLGAWTKRGAFPAALREGLLQALHGAAKEKLRDSALALLASLLRALGQEWAVEEVEEEATGGNERSEGGRGSAGNVRCSGRIKTRDRGTFVAFAIRCASGEVRILLDECLSTLLSGAAAAVTRGGKSEAGNTFQEKARGPMGPAGVDPSIGAAAELAAAAASSRGADNDERAEHKSDGGDISSLPRAPLSDAERKATKEKRASRLMRMIPVALGVAESTIMFLCGGAGGGGDENQNAQEDEQRAGGSGRWEELPIKTLQDLQKTLAVLFGHLFDFLAEIRPWIIPSRFVKSGAERVPSPSLADLWIVQRLGLACSRALGIWVAEDPESLPQRFVDALPVLLALKAEVEPPDSDDEESDEEGEEGISTPTGPSLAAFPGVTRYFASPYLQGLSDGVTDEALHNILRAMLALSYEPAPLAAIVEEGVTARLARLTSAGPPAIAALFAVGAVTTPPLPPPEQASEAIRLPLMTACGLLANILTSAGHLAWPETCAVGRRTGDRAGKKGESGASHVPSHPVLAHPGLSECLASLAEVAGMAGAARRAGGGARWRLLSAYATLIVMIVARSGVAPECGLADRRLRWEVKGDGDGDGYSRGSSVWESMARAVDEALGSLSTAPGRGLIGAGDGEEEASYEEGSIWQWCLECAREIETAVGGEDENPYVSVRVVPRRVLRSLAEASSDGRI